MKKTTLTGLLLIFAISVFAQIPTMPSKSSDDQSSNNQVLTEYEMVVTKSFKPIEKIPLDKNALLIFDYDGVLKSLNTTTNKVNWEFKAKGEEVEHAWNKFTLEDGVLYVPFLNGEMYALNHKTGEKFWELKMGVKNSRYVKSTVNQIPQISGNQLFVTTQYENSNIYSFDKRNGKLLWNYKLQYPYNHLPVLYFKDKVFTQNAPFVYSFDAKSGRALYQRGFKKAMYGKPVTDGTNVIIADESRTVFALAPENLDIVWEYNIDDDHYAIDEKILTKNGVVYFAAEANGESGGVYAIDSKTGKEIWKLFLPGDMASITEYNNKLYVTSKKGIFYRIDPKTGKDELTLPLTNIPISNFEFVDDNTAYFYCEAGLIKLNISSEKEELVYERNSIDEDADKVDEVYLKLVR